MAIVQDRALKSPELTGEWEAKLREIERGRLDPGRFRDEIVRYIGEVIRSEGAPQGKRARAEFPQRPAQPLSKQDLRKEVKA